MNTLSVHTLHLPLTEQELREAEDRLCRLEAEQLSPHVIHQTGLVDFLQKALDRAVQDPQLCGFPERICMLLDTYKAQEPTVETSPRKTILQRPVSVSRSPAPSTADYFLGTKATMPSLTHGDRNNEDDATANKSRTALTSPSRNTSRSAPPIAEQQAAPDTESLRVQSAPASDTPGRETIDSVEANIAQLETDL
jgi:hypothetical protein